MQINQSQVITRASIKKKKAEMWTSQSWELVLRRMLNDWEVVRLTRFYKQLEDFEGLQRRVDTLWWQGYNNGSYKVNAAYTILNQSSQQIIICDGSIFGK